MAKTGRFPCVGGLQKKAKSSNVKLSGKSVVYNRELSVQLQIDSARVHDRSCSGPTKAVSAYGLAAGTVDVEGFASTIIAEIRGPDL
jgi:hypothetical protein